MINFNLKPYEWLKHMDKTIAKYVNLTSLELSNVATFDFINSYDGKPYKKISCHNVWRTSINLTADEFPVFICEIKMHELKDKNIKEAFEILFEPCFDIPQGSKYCLLRMDSGEADIMLLCEEIEVIDL